MLRRYAITNGIQVQGHATDQIDSMQGIVVENDGQELVDMDYDDYANTLCCETMPQNILHIE